MKEMQGTFKSQTVQSGAFITWFLLDHPEASANVDQTMISLSGSLKRR